MNRKIEIHDTRLAVSFIINFSMNPLLNELDAEVEETKPDGFADVRLARNSIARCIEMLNEVETLLKSAEKLV